MTVFNQHKNKTIRYLLKNKSKTSRKDHNEINVKVEVTAIGHCLAEVNIKRICTVDSLSMPIHHSNEITQLHFMKL